MFVLLHNVTHIVTNEDQIIIWVSFQCVKSEFFYVVIPLRV